jgi:hypothetical protein
MAVWTSAGISGGHVNPAVSRSVHERNVFGRNIHIFEDNIGVGDLARFPLEKSPWYVYVNHFTNLLELNILNLNTLLQRIYLPRSWEVS